jgi:hypothetical protein
MAEESGGKARPLTCSARLQAGIFADSTCPPEGVPYKRLRNAKNLKRERLNHGTAPTQVLLRRC